MHLCALYIHIIQGCFTGIWTIIWWPQWQWNNPKGYGQTIPKHNKTQEYTSSWELLHNKSKAEYSRSSQYCSLQDLCKSLQALAVPKTASSTNWWKALNHKINSPVYLLDVLHSLVARKMPLYISKMQFYMHFTVNNENIHWKCILSITHFSYSYLWFVKI